MQCDPLCLALPLHQGQRLTSCEVGSWVGSPWQWLLLEKEGTQSPSPHVGTAGATCHLRGRGGWQLG